MSGDSKKSVSFFRRKLPRETCISFHSEEGKRLFTKALLQGNADAFFPLVSYFTTQAEPAFCGLSTLVVILNALEIDPGRLWKWPWRFWSESHLSCCLPLDIIEKQGVTLLSFLCIARCNGVNCTLYQPQPNYFQETKGNKADDKDSIDGNNDKLIVYQENIYREATLIKKEEFRQLIVSKCKANADGVIPTIITIWFEFFQ